MYQYKAHIDEVVDGDTFRATIDLGFSMNIHATLRLLGIDTPEKFTAHKKGKDEKELGLTCKKIAKLFFENSEVIIETQKPDSFGRTLCNLQFMDMNGQQIDVIDFYNSLHINKLSDTYNENVITNYLSILESCTDTQSLTEKQKEILAISIK